MTRRSLEPIGRAGVKARSPQTIIKMKPTSVRMQDDRLNRVSGCELEFPNRWGIPARVFANKEIPLERAAVDELEAVLQIQETVDLLGDKSPQFFGPGNDPAVTEVVLTPDFHKGAGIPIGTVLATRGFAVPQAIGNDINCGMRLIATDFDVELVKSKSRELASALRHIFFEEDFGPQFDQFLTSMRNAANFAFGNRFFLAQMIRKGLFEAVGETGWDVVYDAPHNLMWEEQLDGKPTFVHRKGATPAGGWEEMQGTQFAHWGEPVIVPGSMGASSFLLLGNGARTAICSACHGAGRALSRGEAMRADDTQIDEFLKDFSVITALDPNRPDVRLRPDILEKWKQELKKEAPYAYKEITPVIKTLQEAKIATPVVELFPLMTVKQ